jgi:hypothetical protein
MRVGSSAPLRCLYHTWAGSANIVPSTFLFAYRSRSADKTDLGATGQGRRTKLQPKLSASFAAELPVKNFAVISPSVLLPRAPPGASSFQRWGAAPTGVRPKRET